MVFKSDRQRKKVMAMLRGGTKSAVAPTILERKQIFREKEDILERKQIERDKFFEKLGDKIGIPGDILAGELQDIIGEKRTDKIMKDIIAKKLILDSTFFAGEDFDEQDAIRFATQVTRLKKEGFKKIGVIIDGPEDSRFEIYSKKI